MATPKTRAEFKEYCLRKLGKPVIEINVSDEQIEDRVDEAIQYFYDYHFDGSERTYVKYRVTATDITNKWIPVPENVLGVIRVFPMNSLMASSAMWNPKYQLVQNEIQSFTNSNLIGYVMSMQYIGLIDEILVGQVPIRYNRYINKLYIDTDWTKISEGMWLLYECYNIIDPDVYSEVWGNRWLQNYCAAKIQENWGRNLTKFTNMQLPGNVMFNGDKILDDAVNEIRRLEDEMIVSFSPPLMDMIG